MMSKRGAKRHFQITVAGGGSEKGAGRLVPFFFFRLTAQIYPPQ